MDQGDEPRSWWAYLGRSYPVARQAGLLWAPGSDDHALQDVRPGDIVFHEYLRRIVAVCRVTSAPLLGEAPQPLRSLAGGEPVWLADAVYRDLPVRAALRDFGAELRQVEGKDGPLHNPVGRDGGSLVRIYALTPAGLGVIVRATKVRGATLASMATASDSRIVAVNDP